MLSDYSHDNHDQYGGMTSTPFPSISLNGELDGGFWCCGCEWARSELQYLPEQEIETALRCSFSDSGDRERLPPR